jgi:hypothetical protein
MRWFRRKPADGPLLVDPARQEALIADIRRRFGGHVQVRFREQVDALVPLLNDDPNYPRPPELLTKPALSTHMVKPSGRGPDAAACPRTHRFSSQEPRPGWRRPWWRRENRACPSRFDAETVCGAASP